MKLKIALLIILLSSLLLSQTPSSPTATEVEYAKTIAEQQLELQMKNTQIMERDLTIKDKDSQLILKDKEIALTKKEADEKNDELFWCRIRETAGWVAVIVVVLK